MTTMKGTIALPGDIPTRDEVLVQIRARFSNQRMRLNISSITYDRAPEAMGEHPGQGRIIRTIAEFTASWDA